MNLENCVKIAALCLGVGLNLYMWPAENVNCHYEFTWFNRVFLYTVLIPEAIMRFVCLFFWNSFSLLHQRKMIISVVLPCLYAGWLVMALWDYD